MITFQNIKVSLVTERTHDYNEKTGKRKKLKKPIITERILFSGDCYDLGEFYKVLDLFKDPYGNIKVSFDLREIV